MHRSLSLLKPTGHLTLGNLLGALRPMAAGQHEADCFYGIADLHALTVTHDPALLRELVAFAGADRVLAVTPEYNGTMPAVLNNAIDWLSRPYGQGAIVGKPFAAVGATCTPYGGKWSHDDARRSAKVAGADVLEHVVASEAAVTGDLFSDAEAVDRLVSALTSLVEHRPATVAA
jgi:NAD(P)H-dependent FMN reductase